MDISIVIVNYNVKDLLHKCLASIYGFTPENIRFEIIVVDNNSSDDSTKMVRDFFPKVKLIENKTNNGFPKANNQAFEVALGEYIFMLNPDTEFIEDSLSVLLHEMNQKNSPDLIGPALLNTDHTHQKSVWRFPNLVQLFCEVHYLGFFLKKKNYADKNLTEAFEAECFSGAAIFFRKSVMKQIGMLDETMFWIEDVEFCYRAFHKGLKLLYLPKTKVLHHIGQSAKKNYKISLSNQIFNKIKFYRKHHPGIEYLLVLLLSFYHVVIKLFVFTLLSPFNVVYKRKAIAYAYTLPRVFNPPNGIA